MTEVHGQFNLVKGPQALAGRRGLAQLGPETPPQSASAMGLLYLQSLLFNMNTLISKH